MPPEPAGWILENAIGALDSWAQREDPSLDLRVIVAEWAHSRYANPYAGLRREPGFDNLWFGPIPDTSAAGHVVTCTLFIDEHRHVVRFDNFTTLSRPF